MDVPLIEFLVKKNSHNNFRNFPFKLILEKKIPN